MTELILPVAEQVEVSPLTLDMAKQMLQSQANIATIGISVLTALGGVFAIYALVSYVFLRPRDIKRITDDVSAKLSEFEAKVSQRLLQQIKGQLDKVDKEAAERTSKALLIFELDQARLFAIGAHKDGQLPISAQWWAHLITLHKELEPGEALSVAVRSLRTVLEECKVLRGEERAEVEGCLPHIPKVFYHEKERIQKLVEGLPEELKTEGG